MNSILRYTDFFCILVSTNLNLFQMVHFQNFHKETAVIGKYSEKRNTLIALHLQPQMFMSLNQLKRASQILVG